VRWGEAREREPEGKESLKGRGAPSRVKRPRRSLSRRGPGEGRVAASHGGCLLACVVRLALGKQRRSEEQLSKSHLVPCPWRCLTNCKGDTQEVR